MHCDEAHLRAKLKQALEDEAGWSSISGEVAKDNRKLQQKKYIKSTIIPNQADIGAFDKAIFNLSNLVLLLIKLATSLFAE